MNKKKLLALLCAIAMLITAIPTNNAQAALKKNTPTSAAENSETDESEQATYNAYSSFQIWNTWAARGICVDPKEGIRDGIPYTVRNVGKTGNHVTYDYLKQYLVYNGDAEQNVVDGGFQDARIDKNGTYTLEINNLDAELLPYITAKKGDKAKDGTAFDEDTKWNMLAISTDIPTSQKNVTCTNIKVYLDDETTPFATLAKAPYNTDEGDAKYSGKNGYAYTFYIFDSYWENHGTKGVLDNTEQKYLRFPKKNMRIEFTVSGIDFTPSSPASEVNFEASIRGDPFAKPLFLDFQPGDAVEVTFTVQKDYGDGTDFPVFTATLQQLGAIWGWEDSPNPADCTVDVTAPGEYTLKTTATAKGNTDYGAIWVSTNLAEPPEGYTISGKSIKIADKIYNWCQAELICNVDYRLCLWNSWANLEEYNPLQYEEKIRVSHDGEFTLKDYIPWDVSSDTGAVFLQTNLKQLPKNYTILGKTIKIDGKEYDWSKAEASLYKTRVCLFVWNAQSNAAYANPIGRDVTLHAGDEIEMTFTVAKKGLPDNSEKEPEEDQDKDDDSNKDQDNDKEPGGDKNNSITNQKPNGGNNNELQKPVSLGKNKTFTSGNFKYKVTAAARKKSPAKVSVISLSVSGKKKSFISVKDTVSFRGFTYKVTAVASGAFKGASKLTKAELGMGISSIPASAFKGCRKLSSVTTKAATQIGKGAFQNCTSLKKLILKKKVSVKKGAFKGCKKTIKVTGGSRKINQANVKQLKKSGYKKFK